MANEEYYNGNKRREAPVIQTITLNAKINRSINYVNDIQMKKTDCPQVISGIKICP